MVGLDPVPWEWQPITGCSPASVGCANCYAMKLAGGVLAEHSSREGLTTATKTGPVWNGEVRLNEAWSRAPSQLMGRRLIAVCPHGDLFHERVPVTWIDRVFAEMMRCPHHLFQILTKRAARMRDYVLDFYGGGLAPSHIMLGVSAERQAEADERIEQLRATPARTRYVTLYPLLQPVSLALHLEGDWLAMVNAGEERERPSRAEWFADLAAECASFGVPFARGERLDARTAHGELPS